MTINANIPCCSAELIIVISHEMAHNVDMGVNDDVRRNEKSYNVNVFSCRRSLFFEYATEVVREGFSGYYFHWYEAINRFDVQRVSVFFDIRLCSLDNRYLLAILWFIEYKESLKLTIHNFFLNLFLKISKLYNSFFLET